MFGKSKRQIRDVTFVQPLKGEVYFYTPIAYATDLQNSIEKEGKQVFKDSDLALAGKLKLIFEREKMTWFEVKEEKSTTPLKDEHFFALYYYPHRLVASRTSSVDEKATLQDIKKLFDFIATEDQTRCAEVRQTGTLSAYESNTGEPCEEPEVVPTVTDETCKENEAVPTVTDETCKENEAVPTVTDEHSKELEVVALVPGQPNEEPQAIPTVTSRKKQ
jgi:hypothetical protein